jgi:hypothetical protein
VLAARAAPHCLGPLRRAASKGNFA